MKEGVIPSKNIEDRDKAFHKLLDESSIYQDSLKNRIKLVVKDEAVAKEIMQDVWVAALVNSETLFTDTFDDKGRKAWLFKVAFYKGLTYVRDYAKKGGLEAVRSTTFLENIEDKGHSSSPETILLNREVFTKRLEPLQACSKDSQKTVFLYAQGYSYKEVAKTLGISKQNVADKLVRVRKKLI